MRGKLQWVLSLGLLVFLLVTLTIGWVLLQTACSLDWVCMKLSAALKILMKPYHLSTWHKFRCNLQCADADDAISSHGLQTNKESGQCPTTESTGTGSNLI